MKNGLLKLSAMMLLLDCSAVYASDAASIIPVQEPGYSVRLTGLYLEPSASNLVYAIFTTPLPLPAPNWQQKVVNPKYSPAFDLGLRYNLINGKDNVKFDWLYFNSNDSAAASSVPNTSVGPVYYYGPAQQFILNTSANSTAKFNIDNANLVFGHLLNLTNNIQIQPFVGLSAAYLKEDITNNYLGTDPVYGPYTHAVYTKSTFTGIGPRIGLGSSYYFTNRFALTANVAGDLLAGILKYSTDFTSWTAYNADNIHNSTPANTSMANQNVNRVVPGVDAKIAIRYQIPFNQSELTLQAGYLYAVYFNAINQVLPSTLVPGSWEAGSVAIINQAQYQSNIDLRGPFVSAIWKF
ncbi:MAG: hypothetical protein JO149_03090 [Gammaproteobacteria bacterium]|nr:hypothetical protein [Gammaproteobacteria bacterium]